NERAGGAPARIGLVLEEQGLAHLVERLAGAAADMTLADDRELLCGRQARRLARVAEQRVEFADILLGHHRRRHPGIGELGCAFDRNLDIARHPDRRATLLLGLDARLDLAERVVAAFVLDHVVAPQLLITSTLSTKRGTRSLIGTPIESNSSGR